MPLRRIDDDKDWGMEKVCLHREHEPPAHMVYKPGKYEYECPGCHRKIVFSVNGVYI